MIIPDSKKVTEIKDFSRTNLSPKEDICRALQKLDIKDKGKEKSVYNNTNLQSEKRGSKDDVEQLSKKFVEITINGNKSVQNVGKLAQNSFEINNLNDTKFSESSDKNNSQCDQIKDCEKGENKKIDESVLLLIEKSEEKSQEVTFVEKVPNEKKNEPDDKKGKDSDLCSRGPVQNRLYRQHEKPPLCTRSHDSGGIVVVAEDPVHRNHLTSSIPQQQNVYSNVHSQNIPLPNICLRPQNIHVQNIPVQNIPVQNIPLQNIPVQNIPVQNIPVQNIPVQNIPVQNIPVQNIPVQNISVQNISVQNVPVQNFPLQNNSVQNMQQNVPPQNIPHHHNFPIQMSPESILQDTPPQNISPQNPYHHNMQLQNNSYHNIPVQNITQKIPTQTLSPENIAPQMMSLQLMSPQNMSHTMSPQNMSPKAMSHHTMSPQNMSPKAMSHHTMSPQMMSPQTMSPRLMSPQTMSPQTMNPETMTPQTMTPQTSPQTMSPQMMSLHAMPQQNIPPQHISNQITLEHASSCNVPVQKNIDHQSIPSQSVSRQKVPLQVDPPQSINNYNSFPDRTVKNSSIDQQEDNLPSLSFSEKEFWDEIARIAQIPVMDGLIKNLTEPWDESSTYVSCPQDFEQREPSCVPPHDVQSEELRSHATSTYYESCSDSGSIGDGDLGKINECPEMGETSPKSTLSSLGSPHVATRFNRRSPSHTSTSGVSSGKDSPQYEVNDKRGDSFTEDWVKRHRKYIPPLSIRGTSPGPILCPKPPQTKIDPDSARAKLLKKLDDSRRPIAWGLVNSKPNDFFTKGDKDGDTHLMILVSNKCVGQLEYIHAMVEKMRTIPNSLSQVNKSLHSALFIACLEMNHEPLVPAYIAEALAEQNIDVAKLTYENGKTLPEILKLQGDSHKEVLKELMSVKNGTGQYIFDPHMHDINGNV